MEGLGDFFSWIVAVGLGLLALWWLWQGLKGTWLIVQYLVYAGFWQNTCLVIVIGVLFSWNLVIGIFILLVCLGPITNTIAKNLLGIEPQNKESTRKTTEPKKIENPACEKCEGVKCDSLTQFIRFESGLLDKEWGIDSHYSIWQCPKCGQYYLRLWEVDWSSGYPKPRRYQFILTYELDREPALNLLDLVSRCPNPMSRETENCQCRLHQMDEIYFTNLWMPAVHKFPDRISTESWEETQYMEPFGTDQFQKPYRRKRKSPPSTE